MVSFAAKKCLSLPRCHLFIFGFMFITLGGRSKKIFLWFMSECFSLAFLWLSSSPLWACLVAQLGKNPPAIWETWVRSLGWKDPLEKGKATHSGILSWRMSYNPYTVHGVARSRRRLSDFHFHFQYSIVCMSCIFFIHSSVVGHSGCFRVLTTVNSAAVNIGVCVCLFALCFFQDVRPIVGLLGHVVVPWLPWCLKW